MNKEKEFKKFYLQSKEKLYRLCLGFTGNHNDAKDLFQEVSIKVWNNLDSFRGESALNTWGYKIASNTALTYISKTNKNRALQKDFLIDNSISSDDTNHSDQEEKVSELYLNIATLKEMDRIVISLLLEQHSYEEIAAITGLKSNHVGVKINRIKKILAKNMDKYG